MRPYVMRGPVSLIVAALIPLALSAVLLPLRGHLVNTNVALLLVVAVVAVAALGHRLAGAVAALSAAAWFDFFFTRPYEHFTIRNSADITTAVLLLAVGLAVSQLAARGRRFEVVAITDAGYLARIHDATVLANSANSTPSAVIDHTRTQLTDLLHLRGCRFEYGSLLGHRPRLERDGSLLAGHRRWAVEALGMPASEVELRVFAGRYIGRFLLDPVPGSTPSRQALLVAVTLADQAGAALAGLARSAKVD